MSIKRLEISNFKRINFMEIEDPAADVVEIHGKNAQGKSSILEAIEFALMGDRKKGDRPLKDGQAKGHIIVETDEFRAEKKFHKALKDGALKTSLYVYDKGDGSLVQQPQTFLNKLLGHSSVDGTEFIMMEPAKRVEILKEALAIDFDALDKETKRLYQERLIAGREQSQLEGQLHEYKDVPSTIPTARESKAILADIKVLDPLFDRERDEKKKREEEEVLLKNLDREIATVSQNFHKNVEIIDTKENDIARLKMDIEGLREVQQRISGKKNQLKKTREKLITKMSEGYKVPLEILKKRQALEVELKESALNAQMHERKRRREDLNQRLSDKINEKNGYTRKMNEINEEKKEVLRKANFPLEGLTFGETDIHLNGIPFGNLSTAEQIRISAAINMMINPQLKIMKLAEGSLLDDDAMVELRKLSQEYGFQVFVESVSRNVNQNALIISEGRITNG